MSEQTLTLILMLILLGATLHVAHLRGEIRRRDDDHLDGMLVANREIRRLEQELHNIRSVPAPIPTWRETTLPPPEPHEGGPIYNDPVMWDALNGRR